MNPQVSELLRMQREYPFHVTIKNARAYSKAPWSELGRATAESKGVVLANTYNNRKTRRLNVLVGFKSERDRLDFLDKATEQFREFLVNS